MTEEIKKLITIAENEINYLEKKDNNSLDDKTKNAGENNYTKYARDYFPELQGMSWCCMFVWWCFVKAFGVNKTVGLIGDKTAKCSVMQERMTAIGCQKISKPKVGDLVFFKNPISHIGIVYKIDNNTFTTIEGNTSQSKDAASINKVEANGGGVFTRTYNYNIERINCFMRPKWTEKDNDSNNNISSNSDNNYRIKATNVNIRSAAGTQYSILGNETINFAFVKLSEQKDSKGYTWYSFKYKNQIGYIRSDFTEKI